MSEYETKISAERESRLTKEQATLAAFADQRQFFEPGVAEAFDVLLDSATRYTDAITVLAEVLRLRAELREAAEAANWSVT
jgi:hypothetical protein